MTKTVSTPMEDSVLKLADEDPICTPMGDPVVKIADDDPISHEWKNQFFKLHTMIPSAHQRGNQFLKLKTMIPSSNSLRFSESIPTEPPPLSSPSQKIMTMHTIRNQEKQYPDLVKHP